MSRNDRISIIEKIEKKRGSKVIAYICGDRQGAATQISHEVVRVIYDHLRAIGKVPKIDLYLYSRGGSVEVPWRIVSMLREHCPQLGTLVPYRAQSAATLISLGCDDIVMGSKAELGPIDPALSRMNQHGTPGEEIRVEDVMSYIDFLRDKAKISDETAISQHIHTLSEKLSPWVIGQIYRVHSHIRTVAQRLLASHATPLDEPKVQAIISALAEETRSHGHAITRGEAEKIGLPITRPDDELEELLWALMEQYENFLELRRPVDPEMLLPDKDEQCDIPLKMGAIESLSSTWVYQGKLRLKRIRKTPEKYDLKVGFAFNLNLAFGDHDPTQISPQLIANLQQQLQQQLNQILPQQLQGVPDQVREQVKSQSPSAGIEGRYIDAYWRDVTGDGV